VHEETVEKQFPRPSSIYPCQSSFHHCLVQ
jgi:hypothetical protein